MREKDGKSVNGILEPDMKLREQVVIVVEDKMALEFMTRSGSGFRGLKFARDFYIADDEAA